MKYLIKIRGEFEETQQVEAKTQEEAEVIASENRGTTIERTASGPIEILDVKAYEDVE